MLARIRQFAKSWVALILLVPLLISFAIFGLPDVFQSQVGDWVVRVGERTLTGREFRRQVEDYKQQVEQQTGQAFTNQQLVDNNGHLAILGNVAYGEAFLEQLRRIKLVPSDRLVLDKIREATIFFDPVTGRFDPEAYKARLQQEDFTEEQFEQRLREQIAEEHYAQALLSGIRAPRAYAAAIQALSSELRDASMLLVGLGQIEPPPAPTDAQLTRFMRENAERLRRPEYRGLTIVRFDAADAARQTVIDPAQVQRQFEFRRDSLSQPEKRTLVQVPARTAEAAAQAARRLRAGEPAAAVARALGVEVVRYDNQPQSAIADRAVGAAAFRLAAGQVGDPIRGDLGYSVVQVTAITPGKVVTLEEVRPQIEAQLRSDAAAERVYGLVQRYEEAKESGATLVEAARDVGVPALSLAPVAAVGRDQRNQPVALEPQLLQAAFELEQGAESEVIDLGEGRYASVRVDRILPAALPPLADVRDELAQIWRNQEILRRLQARADALAARARRGESLAAIAQSSNAPFTRMPGLAQDTQVVPPEVLGALFSAKPGEVFTAPNAQAGVVLGRVDAVRYPPPGASAAVVAQRSAALSVDLAQQIGEAARRAPRAVLKVRTSPERARTALGVAPEDEEERRR